MLRGDRLDTTMNYRLRDAVIGLLAPRRLRLEGLRRQRPPDHARREFAARLLVDPRGLPRRGVLLADEPARQPRHRAAALDAHARRRDDAPASEQNAGERRRRQAAAAARVADPVHRARRADRLLRRRGRRDRRRRPGRPAHLSRGPTRAAPATRRCSPTTRRWPRCGATSPPLTDGDFRVLLADDAAGTVAYGRKTGEPARRSWRSTAAARRRRSTIPVAGYLPDGTSLRRGASASAPARRRVAVGGGSSVTLAAAARRRCSRPARST